MKSIRTLMLLMILLTSLFIQGQGFSPQVESRLRAVIDSFQNNPANPFIGGISVAIKVDGLAKWQGATGFAARNIDAQNNLLPGGTAFTINTLSRVYSVTKTFTAPLVLELAKEGAFSLDDPISKFLPLVAVVNPALNTSVTIRQLLAHESGFSDYTDEINLQVATAFDPTHVWTPYEMVSFVHQLNAPGAARVDSSTNYMLLGAIIEVATNKPAEQHYRERFFDPLHLTSMYLGGREALGNRGMLASPHDNISVFNGIFQFTGQPLFPDAITNISRFPFEGVVSLGFTAGGIVSNAADVADWGNALFGGRATSQSTIDQMLNSISSTPDKDGDFLGYGIFRSTRLSGTDVFIGHDGSALGYRSVMFYQPDKKLTIAVLTNYHGGSAYDVAKALYAVLPEFLCGNKNMKEDKIQICFNGNNLCVARQAAEGFIEKGAYLGTCQGSLSKSESKPAMDEQGKQNAITVSPNPFLNQLSLSFKVTEPGHVSLRVYDLNGKLVSTLFNGNAEKGIIQKVVFDGSNLPAGIYISRLQTASGITEQKIIRSR